MIILHRYEGNLLHILIGEFDTVPSRSQSGRIYPKEFVQKALEKYWDKHTRKPK